MQLHRANSTCCFQTVISNQLQARGVPQCMSVGLFRLCAQSIGICFWKFPYSAFAPNYWHWSCVTADWFWFNGIQVSTVQICSRVVVMEWNFISASSAVNCRYDAGRSRSTLLSCRTREHVSSWCLYRFGGLSSLPSTIGTINIFVTLIPSESTVRRRSTWTRARLKFGTEAP